MSLPAQLAATRDALTDAIRDLRKALTNAKADVVRAEATLAGLGARSEAAQLYPALAIAQRIHDSGVAVNVAATTCEHYLGVIAALRAAGRN